MDFPFPVKQVVLFIHRVQDAPESLTLAKAVFGHDLENSIWLLIYVTILLRHPKEPLTRRVLLLPQRMPTVLYLKVDFDRSNAVRHLQNMRQVESHIVSFEAFENYFLLTDRRLQHFIFQYK